MIESRISYGEADDIQFKYEQVTIRITWICELVKRHSSRERLPRIPGSSLEVFRQGMVYPEHGWRLFPRAGAEEAMIRIPAWDGFGDEPFDNSSVVVPFDFINMEVDELDALLRTGNAEAE